MDPVCHTLVGASLAATGLGTRSRFGCATLIVAANLPDIDAITYLGGWDETTAYAVRRGITHGLPAVLLLPVVLAVAVKCIDRLWPDADRPATFRALLLLSAIGVASHPSLDWLNNYGMRWLMPFVDRWSYGDTLFIVDWVVWLVLGAGLIASRVSSLRLQPWFRRPATVALGIFLAYIATSFGLTQLAEREVLAGVAAAPRRIMASPAPFNSLRRDIVLEYATEYRLGTVRFAPLPRFDLQPRVIDKGEAALFSAARRQRAGRRFLDWARFPYVVAEVSKDGRTVIWLADARYVIDVEHPPARQFGYLTLEPGAESP